MVDDRQWWDVLRRVATSRPRTDRELLATLDQLVVVASRWSELLDTYRDATVRYGGPGTAVSFELACRRSEQSFLELEIARQHARAVAGGDRKY